MYNVIDKLSDELIWLDYIYIYIYEDYKKNIIQNYNLFYRVW